MASVCDKGSQAENGISSGGTCRKGVDTDIRTPCPRIVSLVMQIWHMAATDRTTPEKIVRVLPIATGTSVADAAEIASIINQADLGG